MGFSPLITMALSGVILTMPRGRSQRPHPCHSWGGVGAGGGAAGHRRPAALRFELLLLGVALTPQGKGTIWVPH